MVAASWDFSNSLPMENASVTRPYLPYRWATLASWLPDM